MDEEARYVTKFFFDEGRPVKVIIARLNVFGDRIWRLFGASSPTIEL
jgi:hypothetical protein